MKHHECSRNAAKTMVLIVLFVGQPEKHLKDMPKNKYRPAPCVRKLSEQLQTVRTTVISAMEDKHADLFKILRSTKEDDDEFHRSAFAILTRSEEYTVLHQFMKNVTEKGIKVFSAWRSPRCLWISTEGRHTVCHVQDKQAFMLQYRRWIRLSSLGDA